MKESAEKGLDGALDVLVAPRDDESDGVELHSAQRRRAAHEAKSGRHQTGQHVAHVKLSLLDAKKLGLCFWRNKGSDISHATNSPHVEQTHNTKKNTEKNLPKTQRDRKKKKSLFD